MVLLPAGLMAGLVLGLGLAAWRERSDRRIHTGAELERLFGLSTALSVIIEFAGGILFIVLLLRGAYR